MILGIGKIPHFFGDIHFIPFSSIVETFDEISELEPEIIILEDKYLDILALIGGVIPCLIYSDTLNIDYISSSILSGANGFLLESHFEENLSEAIATVIKDEIYLDRDIGIHVLTRMMKTITIKSCNLRKREIDIYELIKQGFSNKEISEKLHLKYKNVCNHIQFIKNKLKR